jgi:hypothetical protein
MGTAHASLAIRDDAKKTTVSSGNDEVTATRKELKFGSSSLKVSDIVGLHTDSRGASGQGHAIFVEKEKGKEEVIRSSSEKDILRSVELLAAMLKVRFFEHTGRSVEADEHGMNVVDQICNYPERWPAVPNLDLQMVKFVTIGSIVCFTIPSRVRDGEKWSFWGAVIIGLILGIPVATNAPATSSELLSILYFLAPLLAVISLAYVAAMKTGMFESKHEVRLTKEKIHVIPHFMGIFGMPSRSWPMEDFRDMDVAEGGRLTLLMGDERLYCDMDTLEAEWVLAEIAERLESFGLANHNSVASSQEE